MIALDKLGQGTSRLITAGLVLGWAAAFALLVWPALKANKRDELRIEDMSRRIELLGGWNEARRPLAVDSDAWGRELNKRFEEMFPGERRLEDLFYQIAAAANRSDVDPEKISVKSHGFATDRVSDRPPTDMGDMGNQMDDGMGEFSIEVLQAGLGLSPADFPGNELDTHFLAVELKAGYENIARFLDEVSRLDRAVTVSKLNMKQGDRGVLALIELEYYVQAKR